MVRISLLDGLMVTNPADNSKERVGNGNRRDNERRGQYDDGWRTHDAEQRDDAEHGPHQKRTRISHENGCRRVVEPQKRERRSQKHDAQHSRLNTVVPQRNDEHRERGDGHDTSGQPVQPVHKVDDVHERDQVEHRQRIREPTEVDEP